MKRNYTEELQRILASRLSDEEKKERILQYHENDIADMLEGLTKKDRARLFQILGDDIVAEILSYVDNIEDVVDELSTEHAADIIEKMDADDAIDVLDELDEEQRNEIVALMAIDSQEEIRKIEEYDEDFIGSRMTNNYVTILNTDTVKTAMKRVISEAAENDNVSTIFVLDENEKFYGVIELRELIIARENDDLDKITKKNYPFFLATDLVEDCLIKLKEYALSSYPILDASHHLIGVITSDDVVEVIDDEMSDDYAKLAGLTQEEELNDSVFESVKKRLPWLIILLILGLFQSFAMTSFEKIVAALPVIVFFQTLVLSMSGNSGTQSLAVTIRLLSDEVHGKRKILKACFKELKTGFINGLSLGILAFIIVFIFMFITKQSIGTEVYHVQDAIKASSIVAISLLIAMTLSACVGTLVPIIFLKLKIDPAVASGPFITTISDVTALLIYYGLAFLFFMAI